MGAPYWAHNGIIKEKILIEWSIGLPNYEYYSP